MNSQVRSEPCPQFFNDVLAGLQEYPKRLSSKYLYDERGSDLFEQICTLDEYYPTRTELAIMDQFAEEMAGCIGGERVLLELGSGSSVKTALLLEAMERPAVYMPFDISDSALEAATERLAFEFPGLSIHPLVGDFTQPCPLPADATGSHEIVIYFPGSTIGNLSDQSAIDLLANVRKQTSPQGMLIGFDLQKDIEILEAAYNDSQRVTAEFNLNLLRRINYELGADFDLDQFEHQAIYNARDHRIEMHLLSLTQQTVVVDDHEFTFENGESICTEHSHKYTVDSFTELTSKAGWMLRKCWTDDEQLFAVAYLIPKD